MSPLPPILAPLTIPLSKVYGAIIAARNRRYDRGVGVQSIDRPVISVGNITTGGTGKTPMVMWIAKQLLDAGKHPVIAMRGYKSRNGMSDEQAEYAERMPDVPVVANPDRTRALRKFLKVNPRFDCVILDDGFQHRQLKRDLDLVLIDASAGTFDDRMLPAGNLREPLANLRRADAVIVTHDQSEIPNLKFQIERQHGKPPIAISKHKWSHVHVHIAASSQEYEIDWLHGKRMLTMLGIGNPNSVIKQLEAAGATVAVNFPCADHEQFDKAHIATAKGLCSGCDAMVVTEKDWVKLRHLIDLSQWPVPIVVPHLELEVIQGADQLRELVLSSVCESAGKPAG